jgi:hypothetical protein
MILIKFASEWRVYNVEKQNKKATSKNIGSLTLSSRQYHHARNNTDISHVALLKQLYHHQIDHNQNMSMMIPHPTNDQKKRW